MSRENLFTVLIPHYNQQDLWKTAVQSVLQQEYPFIELIIVDDASDNFDSCEVEDFIQKRASDNLVKYQILKNKNNLGTVKSLNYAHSYCNGHYILHFAADDCLYDKYVLKNFAIYLSNKPADVLGVYGRSLKCDKDLQPLDEDFLSINEALRMNTQTARQQFVSLLYSCVFPFGATAFLFDELKEHLPFSEEYFLHEDWPFFLRTTKAGKRFSFANFPALLYRAGGVSRPIKEDTTKVRKLLFQDYFYLHEREIFPFTQILSGKELTELLKHYDDVCQNAKPLIAETQLIKRYKLLFYNIRFLEAFWRQLSLEQRGLYASIFIMFLTTITDTIALIYMWKITAPWPSVAFLFIHTMIFIIIFLLLWKEIALGYKNMKYYLFSPYR